MSSIWESHQRTLKTDRELANRHGALAVYARNAKVNKDIIYMFLEPAGEEVVS